MEARIAKVESQLERLADDVSDMKAALVRIEVNLSHKPSYAGMLGMMIALVGLVATAVFFGASF